MWGKCCNRCSSKLACSLNMDQGATQNSSEMNSMFWAYFCCYSNILHRVWRITELAPIWRRQCSIDICTQGFNQHKSTSVQVKACCLMAPSHYLNQFCPRSTTQYCVKALTLCGLVTSYGDIAGPALALAMACCLTSPSHYLNQCWLSANVFCGIDLRAQVSMLYDKYEMYTFKIIDTSPRGQLDNTVTVNQQLSTNIVYVMWDEKNDTLVRHN